MKMNVCRKNVSITCQIGGDSMCNKDRESFRASAIVAKHLTECLIEANTTEMKYIRFAIKAKYLKNLNELGSRGLGEEEPQVQRGKCTLGYICIDNQYLQEIRVNCYAFHFDKNDTPFNGTSKKFTWNAPKKYEGTVFFKAMVQVSYSKFYIDVDSAEITLPQ
ncbi:uncharacterized protein LOC110845358 [Folsomia candida]|uniref:uncharacterized protein LOC110845358 n=1 Tax=Folsomia candida TaxID=158441 RepID=UPI001604B1F4|nr:uncharacterized protein LOC110845358 [Folsomia candida]